MRQEAASMGLPRYDFCKRRLIEINMLKNVEELHREWHADATFGFPRNLNVRERGKVAILRARRREVFFCASNLAMFKIEGIAYILRRVGIVVAYMISCIHHYSMAVTISGGGVRLFEGTFAGHSAVV
jgi:hypothetical protein